MKLNFACKKAHYVERQDFFRTFFFKLLFMVQIRYEAGTGTVTCQKSEPEPAPEP
jgi:hypothetical protein